MRIFSFGLVACFATACSLMSDRSDAQDMGITLTEPEPVVYPQVASSLPSVVQLEQPLRMLVIGDSLAEGFGLLLQQQVATRDFPLRVVNAGRNSSGLARRDFYDWPTQFSGMVAGNRPDIVVAHFGANDMQAIIQPGIGRTALGSSEWDAVYTQQIESILTTAADAGAVVYLLGPATDVHTNLNNHLARVNPLFEAAAENYGAIYFPLRPFTSGPNGEFSQDVVVGGTSVRLRSGDGSHFTNRGYRLVADRILDDLLSRFPQLEPSAVASEVASADTLSVLALQ